MLHLNKSIPSLIKYMGSKTEIIEYILIGLNEIHKEGQPVCDLFSGSATLAGAIRNNDVYIISNDIQSYSEVLSNTYLGTYNWNRYPGIEEIQEEVESIVLVWKERLNKYWDYVDYDAKLSLSKFKSIEEFQRRLKDDSNFNYILDNIDIEELQRYHLFTKNYSGTYWSFRQCIWIDAFRCVIDRYKHMPELYNLLLSCVMYAMAYNSQSTGHYAQFRKANTESSMNDILIYRRKSIMDFFKRKYIELVSSLNNKKGTYKIYSLDYIECIKNIPKGSLVYADPPYCSVHYSRFYHVIETFVRYDYPQLKYDGRYREDRHQSPFCISSKVKNAFRDMFYELRQQQCELVLSYSNSKTSMIDLPSIIIEAYSIFNDINLEINDDNKKHLLDLIVESQKLNIRDLDKDKFEVDINVGKMLDKITNTNSNYDISLKMFQHMHSTLGRTKVRELEVLETLILVKNKG